VVGWLLQLLALVAYSTVFTQPVKAEAWKSVTSWLIFFRLRLFSCD
jgi:hypothetical protein